MTATEFCGCCGRAAVRRLGYDGLFCRRCQSHVRPAVNRKTGRRELPEDRTFFSKYGKECPFVAANEKP
jgi:hypothetical protein